jgi:predicted  nucleic acid-binding Zn-ribbon protein
MLEEDKNQKNIQEEISRLQERLKEKKEEMRKTEKELTPEKAEFAAEETLREYAENDIPEKGKSAFSLSQNLKEIDESAERLKLSPEEHDSQIGKLLEISEEKGILFALKVANRLNNPHLQDDFQRRLAYELNFGKFSGK